MSTALLQAKIAELETQLQTSQAALQRTEAVLKTREDYLRVVWNAEDMAAWDLNISENRTTASTRFYSLLGATPEQFSAQAVSNSLWVHADEHLFRHIHPDDLSVFVATDQEALRTGKWYLEFRACPSPLLNKEQWLLGSGEVFYDDANQPVRMIGTLVNITERKRAEAELRTSLQEKEVLLREVHHRVKNSLQIVSSLLSLQADAAGDSRISALFIESQNRIQTLAAIHEDLYQSEQISNIELSQYLTTLIERLFYSYGINPEKIHKLIQLTAVKVDVDTALTYGLIVNELISNALKHAFPSDRPGNIEITSHFNDAGEYVLMIRDDGVGFPPHSDISSSKTLGMQLVRSLTTKLRGQIALDRCNGTTFLLSWLPSDTPL